MLLKARRSLFPTIQWETGIISLETEGSECETIGSVANIEVFC